MIFKFLLPIVLCAAPLLSGCNKQGLSLEKSTLVLKGVELGELEFKPMKLEPMPVYEADASNASKQILDKTGVNCKRINYLTGIKHIDDESPSGFLVSIANAGFRLEMTASENTTPRKSSAVYRILQQDWKPIGGAIYETVEFPRNDPPFQAVTAYLCSV